MFGKQELSPRVSSMTTAYRSDLISTVYETELANLMANSSNGMEPFNISCPGKNCGVQYSLLGPRKAPEGEVLKQKAAVTRAIQQQFCPHHPPKIELD
jgi:hypothetical protein